MQSYAYMLIYLSQCVDPLRIILPMEIKKPRGLHKEQQPRFAHGGRPKCWPLVISNGAPVVTQVDTKP